MGHAESTDRPKMEQLAVLAPGLELRNDVLPFPTRRLLATLERIWIQIPSRFKEAQQMVGQAIRTDGKDLSEWTRIQELFSDFALTD